MGRPSRQLLPPPVPTHSHLGPQPWGGSPPALHPPPCSGGDFWQLQGQTGTSPRPCRPLPLPQQAPPGPSHTSVTSALILQIRGRRAEPNACHPSHKCPQPSSSARPPPPSSQGPRAPDLVSPSPSVKWEKRTPASLDSQGSADLCLATPTCLPRLPLRHPVPTRPQAAQGASSSRSSHPDSGSSQ